MSTDHKRKGMVSKYADTIAKIGTHGPRPFGLGLAHGSMFTVVFKPPQPDVHEPHDQDEIYIAMEGKGTLIVEDERLAFDAGDLLFVPAHAEHWFEECSDDTLLWVIFWGPKGGETDKE